MVAKKGASLRKRASTASSRPHFHGEKLIMHCSHCPSQQGIKEAPFAPNIPTKGQAQLGAQVGKFFALDWNGLTCWHKGCPDAAPGARVLLIVKHWSSKSCLIFDREVYTQVYTKKPSVKTHDC
eukprot:789759-Pelagomonas_calceolata.AAC.2